MLTFFLYGFYSLLAQVLLLREAAQLFTAHELSLAAALAAWLFWTAAGARLGSARPASPSFSGAALLFAAAAPFNLLAARLAPGLLPPLWSPGLPALVLGPLLLTLPAGLANGFAAGRALSPAPASFYAAESAGAAAAGALTALYFHFLPGFPATGALLAAGLALCAAHALSPFAPRRAAAAGAAALALAGAHLLAPHAWRLRPPATRPQSVVQAEASRLALAGGSVYEDGALLHFPGDPGPEDFAHIPLLAAARKPKVLLSGGGAFFLLPEVLKHKPAAAEIAEPDPFRAGALAGAAGAAPGTFTLLPEDPRAVKGRAGYYDVIFQTDPSPDNAALNRHFTSEYFRSAAALLAPAGVLAFTLPFAENYVPPETAYAAACVLASARASFPEIALVPGRRLLVLASGRPLRLDPGALAAELASRRVRSAQVTPATLPFLLDPYRAAWAARELARVKGPALNTDLDPLAYFRFWRAWVSMVASPAALAALAALAAALLLAVRKAPALFTPGARAGEAFLMGFWALCLETALLLAFQAATGRLTPRLGLLFAAFMAGAGAGAFAGRGRRLAFRAEVAAAAAAFACALAGPAAVSHGAALWLAVGAAGFVSGCFFAGAAPSGAGGVYSADLLGGAAGGLAAAAFAVPLAGISGALYLAGAAACAAAAAGHFSEKASTVKV